MSPYETPIERYDRIVERIRSQNDTEEARQWLDRSGKAYGVIHEMSREESCSVVEEAYARGASLVEVVGLFAEADGMPPGVDMLILHLPEEQEYRKQLFDLEKNIAAEMGFDPCVDEGQKYILLRWT